MKFRHSRTVLVVAGLISLAACGPDSAGDVAPVDTTSTGRDLTLTPPGQEPLALRDTTPITKANAPRKAVAPARPAPRTQPAAGKAAAAPGKQEEPPAKTVEPEIVPIKAADPLSGTISAGTAMNATLNSRVCTSAKAGEKLIARLSDSVSGSNGVAIPAGATLVLEVVSASPMTDSSKGNISMRVRSIEYAEKAYAVAARAEPGAQLERVRTTETKSDVKKVAGGAIIGAIIGQVLGKDTKSTVAGAAAGAAAGTGVAILTGAYEGCINPNGAVKITLDEALIIPITRN